MPALRVESYQDGRIKNALELLSIGMRVRAMRRALYQGAKVFVTTTRPLIPVRLGFLKKALVARSGVVGGRPRASAGIARVWFVNTGQTKTGKLQWRRWAKKIGDMPGSEGQRKIRPSRYAHLVEFRTRHSAAKPFMGPGIDIGRQRAMNVMRRSLEEDLAKLAAKHRVRNGRR